MNTTESQSMIVQADPELEGCRKVWRGTVDMPPIDKLKLPKKAHISP